MTGNLPDLTLLVLPLHCNFVRYTDLSFKSEIPHASLIGGSVEMFIPEYR